MSFLSIMALRIKTCTLDFGLLKIAKLKKRREMGEKKKKIFIPLMSEFLSFLAQLGFFVDNEI